MSLIPSIPNAGTASPARKQLLCSCCPSPSRHVELTTTRRGNKGDTIIFCVSDRVLALVHDCRHSDEIHGGGAAVQPKEWQSGSVLASDEGRIEGTKQDMGAQRTNPITACRCHFRPGIAFTPHALMHHVSCPVLQLRGAPHEQTQACSYTNQPFYFCHMSILGTTRRSDLAK
jgi:hypothetical protein